MANEKGKVQREGQLLITEMLCDATLMVELSRHIQIFALLSGCVRGW